MALTDNTVIDLVEVIRATGQVQVRVVRIIADGDEELSRKQVNRYVLDPGASLEGQPPDVAAIATVTWTPDVLKAWADLKKRPGKPFLPGEGDDRARLFAPPPEPSS